MSASRLLLRSALAVGAAALRVVDVAALRVEAPAPEAARFDGAAARRVGRGLAGAAAADAWATGGAAAGSEALAATIATGCDAVGGSGIASMRAVVAAAALAALAGSAGLAASVTGAAAIVRVIGRSGAVAAPCWLNHHAPAPASSNATAAIHAVDMRPAERSIGRADDSSSASMRRFSPGSAVPAGRGAAVPSIRLGLRGAGEAAGGLGLSAGFDKRVLLQPIAADAHRARR
jgi:hypothetical protein